jgi:hypothetical protein
MPPPHEPVYYRLLVHYLIVAGRDQNLHVENKGLQLSKQYSWDTKTELSLKDEDVAEQDVESIGEEGFQAAVFAFKQVAMSLYRDQSKGGGILPFRNAKAMHLLAWHMAITPGEIAEMGKSTASVDLFFKNWKRGMRHWRRPLSLLSFRDAGQAHFGCRLTLLQFKDSQIPAPDRYSDEIDWLVGKLFGRDANGKIKLFAPCKSTHSQALKEKPIRLG